MSIAPSAPAADAAELSRGTRERTAESRRPEPISPYGATKLVATVYGVGLANLVFLPIGGKLKSMVQNEVGRREMLTEVMAALAAGENPRLIEDRMAA